MARAIGTLGSIPTATVGGRVYTDLDNLIYLVTGVSTGGRYATFRTHNGSAGYQVTTGKTLTISSVVNLSDTSTAYYSLLCYGDNDVGLDSAAAPTTVVRLGGLAAGARAHLTSVGSGNISIPALPLKFQVPATKYPAIYSSNADSIMYAYGYET